MLEEVTLDQFWECPRCSSQIGMGEPGRFTKAPTCAMGHPKAEMEQVMASRFGSFDPPSE